MSKKIDYTKKLNPIYIESIEANQIYINDCAEKAEKSIEYKIGNSWFEFQKIKTRKVIYNELRMRGFHVDVGNLTIVESGKDKKTVKKQLE